jgi:hypothetical protein
MLQYFVTCSATLIGNLFLNIFAYKREENMFVALHNVPIINLLLKEYLLLFEIVYPVRLFSSSAHAQKKLLYSRVTPSLRIAGASFLPTSDRGWK